MTLKEWLDHKRATTTHVLVVSNGEHPEVEAILPIASEQIDSLVKGWTEQYDKRQMKAALTARAHHIDVAKREMTRYHAKRKAAKA